LRTFSKDWSQLDPDNPNAYCRGGLSVSRNFLYLVPELGQYLHDHALDKVQVPANYLAEYPFKDAIGCGPGLRDEKLGPFPRTEFAVKVHRQECMPYTAAAHVETGNR